MKKRMTAGKKPAKRRHGILGHGILGHGIFRILGGLRARLYASARLVRVFSAAILCAAAMAAPAQAADGQRIARGQEQDRPQQEGKVLKRFPPYPDVWSMDIPEGVDHPSAFQWMVRPNGDVFIFADLGDKGEFQQPFFDNRSTPENWDYPTDGLSKQERLNSSFLKLGPKAAIQSKSFDLYNITGKWSVDHCATRYTGGWGVRQIIDNRTVWAKAILRLSAHPRAIETGCAGPNARFIARVHFYRLITDDTYLLQDDTFLALLTSYSDPVLDLRRIARLRLDLSSPFWDAYPDLVVVDHAATEEIAKDTDRFERDNPTANALQYFYDRVTELAIKAGAKPGP